MQVRPLGHDDLPALLPLIADYQRFYGNGAPDDDHNAAFFGGFVAPSERGMLIGAYDEAGALAGYTCLYWTYSSISATDVVLLNDLYVGPSHRGAGVGEALIAAAREVAVQRGCSHLRWATTLDNRRAQRLYERTGADRETLFEYEFDLRHGLEPPSSITPRDR
ncbi:MAG: GNAT family N-acetyltransferase [Solirubrobacteraceae bacterium]|nr:GNAT family N-acetyltransferase [Solirubrobacteraceae bacterium]